MSAFRYPQYCPLARATEILGERWTLLVIRELMLGPTRFSELRRRLAQVSSSVLSARVAGLEARGLVRRSELPPPASVAVIELTDLGETLRPVVEALTRFGIQLLGPPEPGDQFEPDWLRLGLATFARRTPTPEVEIVVTIKDAPRDIVVVVRGGPNGTRLQHIPGGRMPGGEAPRADLRIRAEGVVVMGLASGSLDPKAAMASGQVEVEGRSADLAKFPQLFRFETLPETLEVSA